MADPARSHLAELRATVLRATDARDRAARRLDDAERAHRLHVSESCPAACAEGLRFARAEHQAREEQLASARMDLENHEEEERERGAAEDPVGPQDAYTFKEIVEKLYRGRRRATYGCVAAYLGANPKHVREWIKRPDLDNCFLVNERTGGPTNYPPEAIHHELKKHPKVLRTRDELIAWLPTQQVTIR